MTESIDRFLSIFIISIFLPNVETSVILGRDVRCIKHVEI